MISTRIRAFLGAAAVAVGLVLAAPSGASAEMKAPVIAVVDVQRIMQDSEAAKGIQKAIEKQRDAYAKEIASLEDKLRSGEQELRRQQTVLSQEAFAAKRRDFEKQVADVQRTVQSRKGALDKAFNEAMSTVQKTMVEIIADVAREEGSNIVLARHQVVLVETGLDVTETVMKRLNDKLPKVAVNIGK